VCGTVRVVLEALDGRRDVLLAALEVDDAVALLVPAALMADADAAGVVAPAGARLLLHQLPHRLAPV